MSISEDNIQYYFTERFVETHGSGPENFAAALWKRIHPGVTIQHLEAAAERLIRTHNAKSFPSFKICLEAILEASRSGGAMAAIPGAVAKLVTPENYYAMASEYMKLHGSYGSVGCMIEPGSPEWGLWVSYFIAKQIPCRRMASMEAFARRPAVEDEIQWVVTDRYMVPARYPMEFDASAPATPTTWGDHLAEQRRRTRFSPTSEKAA